MAESQLAENESRRQLVLQLRACRSVRRAVPHLNDLSGPGRVMTALGTDGDRRDRDVPDARRTNGLAVVRAPQTEPALSGNFRLGRGDETVAILTEFCADQMAHPLARELEQSALVAVHVDQLDVSSTKNRNEPAVRADPPHAPRRKRNPPLDMGRPRKCIAQGQVCGR